MTTTWDFGHDITDDGDAYKGVRSGTDDGWGAVLQRLPLEPGVHVFNEIGARRSLGESVATAAYAVIMEYDSGENTLSTLGRQAVTTTTDGGAVEDSFSVNIPVVVGALPVYVGIFYQRLASVAAIASNRPGLRGINIAAEKPTASGETIAAFFDATDGVDLPLDLDDDDADTNFGLDGGLFGYAKWTSNNGKVASFGAYSGTALGIAPPRPVSGRAFYLLKDVQVDNQNALTASFRDGAGENGNFILDHTDAPTVTFGGNDVALPRVADLTFTGTIFMDDGSGDADDIATASGNPGWAHSPAGNPAVVTDLGADSGPSAGLNAMTIATGPAAASGQSFAYFRNLAYDGVYTCWMWCRAREYDSLTFGFWHSADSWETASAEIIEGPGSVAVASERAEVSGLSTTAWTLVKITSTNMSSISDGRFYIYPKDTGTQTDNDGVDVCAPRMVAGDGSSSGWDQPSQANSVFDMIVAVDTTGVNDAMNLYWINKTVGMGGADADGANDFGDIALVSHECARSGSRAGSVAIDIPETWYISDSDNAATIGEIHVLEASALYALLGDSQTGTKSSATASASLHRLGSALDALIDGDTINLGISGNKWNADTSNASTAGKTRYGTDSTIGAHDTVSLIEDDGATLVFMGMCVNDINSEVSNDATAISAPASWQAVLDTYVDDTGNGSWVLFGLPPYSDGNADTYESDAVRNWNAELYESALAYDLRYASPWRFVWTGGKNGNDAYEFKSDYTVDGGLHYNTDGANLAGQYLAWAIAGNTSNIGNEIVTSTTSGRLRTRSRLRT